LSLRQKRGAEKAQIKHPQSARLVPGEELLAHILIGFGRGLDPNPLVGAGQVVREQIDLGGGFSDDPAAARIVPLRSKTTTS